MNHQCYCQNNQLFKESFHQGGKKYVKQPKTCHEYGLCRPWNSTWPPFLYVGLWVSPFFPITRVVNHRLKGCPLCFCHGGMWPLRSHGQVVPPVKGHKHEHLGFEAQEGRLKTRLVIFLLSFMWTPFWKRENCYSNFNGTHDYELWKKIWLFRVYRGLY